MAVPKTSGEALAKRLLTDAELKAKIGERIFPNVPDQDIDGAYLVFRQVLGGAGMLCLDGMPGLKSYTWRLDAFAATDEEAVAIMELVIDRLCGNRKKGLSVWRDLASGVQVCSPAPDADADIEGFGENTAGQSVNVLFCPQV